MDNGKETPSPYIDRLESLLSVENEPSPAADSLESSVNSNLDKLDLDGQVKIITRREELARFRKDTKDRSNLAYWTFGIITGWLIAVVVLLACNFLPQTVYVTLLTTTTVNIIGLPAIVLHGYFTPKK